MCECGCVCNMLYGSLTRLSWLVCGLIKAQRPSLKLSQTLVTLEQKPKIKLGSPGRHLPMYCVYTTTPPPPTVYRDQECIIILHVIVIIIGIMCIIYTCTCIYAVIMSLYMYTIFMQKQANNIIYCNSCIVKAVQHSYIVS